MSLFSNKIKISTDQFLYQTFININELAKNCDIENIGEETKAHISEKILFSLMIYSIFIIDSSKKTKYDIKKLSYSFNNAVIYYFQQNGYSDDYILGFGNRFMNFSDGFFSYNPPWINQKSFDEVLYLYLNKALSEECDVLKLKPKNYNDTKTLSNLTEVAYCSKRLILMTRILLKELFSHYKIKD